jgi:glycosyltransferase involved in cell wall biosynthesis
MLPLTSSEPTVTVIMPIRNEAAFIERSLGAVLAQDYPPDKLDVLVADGMSDDGTPDIIRAMPGAERVTIIPNPGRRQAEGLNAAIPLATGEVIVRVDGHTIIAADYVRECVRALVETGAYNVGGAMDPVGITPMGKAIAAAGKSPFAVPTAFHVSGQAQYTDTVYMGAWQRGVFDLVGLYDVTTTPNEDYELNYRTRKAGGKIYLTPRIRSQYFGRQTLGALARQYYKYGIGKIQTLSIHPESVRPRQLVAPAFVAGLLVGGVLALLHPVFLALLLLGIGAYAALNLLFSLRQARGDVGLLWRLPIIFTTIHLAWGAGFWVGLWRVLTKR